MRFDDTQQTDGKNRDCDLFSLTIVDRVVGRARSLIGAGRWSNIFLLAALLSHIQHATHFLYELII